MKNITIYSLSLLFLSASIFSGCTSVKNANNTQKGAAIGVAGGAVLGGIIGRSTGNAALGAVIGAAVGGGTGAIIGNKMDKQAREISEALPGADVERVGEGIRLVLKEDAVRFNVNKSTLTTQARTNLDKLIPVFQEYAETNIEIFGYTDITGKPEYNLKLSAERAESVKNYLISKGLEASRMKTSGLGIADPIASNDTEEGRSQNRRVEFAITANEKMTEEAKKESQK
ncbi:MAG TPA: OmpA family protein [Prolixibacteraceae bacterium]|nr:OmpA family protein [Prolixibacteraceae bacterium]